MRRAGVGVSRSGATVSAGLLRGIDRVSATRLSFFLAIPALTAATLLELRKAFGHGVGVGPTLVGTRDRVRRRLRVDRLGAALVSGHKISAFVPYRVAAGIVILILIGVGTL